MNDEDHGINPLFYIKFFFQHYPSTKDSNFTLS